MPVQGNFDPLLLEAGGPAVAARVKTIIAAFEDRLPYTLVLPEV